MSNEKKTTGYGWVERWSDGGLGKNLPSRLGSEPIDRPIPRRIIGSGSTFVKCKITIEVIHDSKGREIRKKARHIKGIADPIPVSTLD